jgi:aspartate-semialdehyde dehydrogenase
MSAMTSTTASSATAQSTGARNIAIVGATGAVGRTMLSILEDRDVPVKDLRLLASARSAGRRVETKWGEVEIEDLATADPAGIDVALFSAGGSRSKEYAPKFAGAGAVVVDNSSAFRMDPDVPLVVAQVNDHAIARHKGIIANPNCTTMVLMMAAGPLHRHNRISRIVATSYQSTSGSGMSGMDVLWDETQMLMKDREALQRGGWVDPRGDLYERPIGFNVLAMAGSLTDQGYTDEEWKLVNETRKILDAPDIAVEPTCVRVPVMVGHGLAATLFFDSPIDGETAKAVLSDAPGLELWTDKTPTPLDSAGIDNVLAGRIRETVGESGGINLWVVGDNLRKGAALNAVQIAELV